ncbi:MAG: hypothetical protein ACYC3F_16640 [Gemmatimonadaceae bacterium]
MDAYDLLMEQSPELQKLTVAELIKYMQDENDQLRKGNREIKKSPIHNVAEILLKQGDEFRTFNQEKDDLKKYVSRDSYNKMESKLLRMEKESNNNRSWGLEQVYKKEALESFLEVVANYADTHPIEVKKMANDVLGNYRRKAPSQHILEKYNITETLE